MKKYINPQVDITLLRNDIIATSVYDHNVIGDREQLMPDYIDFDALELI